MEQKKPDPKGAPAPSDARPPRLERAESSLPPHFRPSNYEVPVTPGITREAYDSEQDSPTPVAGRSGESGYFSAKDIDHALAASPGPIGLDSGEENFEAKLAEGAEESKDFLRRLSLAVMGGRRESISEIRKTSPDLSLTGGIISATFNIPHSLKYRKGADWVSCSSFACFPLPLSLNQISWQAVVRFGGVVPRFGWWG
jgi:trehalose 6-phosphate synthase/phosphatase